MLVVKFEDSPHEVDVVQQIMIFGRSFQSNIMSQCLGETAVFAGNAINIQFTKTDRLPRGGVLPLMAYTQAPLERGIFFRSKKG